MLSLLVPGVGMGASDAGAGAATVVPMLPLTGAGA